MNIFRAHTHRHRQPNGNVLAFLHSLLVGGDRKFPLDPISHDHVKES